MLLGRDLTDLGSFDGVVVAIVEAAYLVTRLAAPLLAAWGVWLAHHEASNGRRKAVFLAGLVGLVLLVRVWEAYGDVIPGENALVFGILVSYALARGQLFDIDLKLKITISRGTVLGAFGAAFFIVSQLAEIYFQRGGNYVLGGVACGLLVFAYAPMRRWADQLASRTLSKDVKDTPEYAFRRKQDIYRAALASALDDRRVTPKERIMLGVLAKRLGLSDQEVGRLRLEAQRLTS
jgi:hypothetical protein